MAQGIPDTPLSMTRKGQSQEKNFRGAIGSSFVLGREQSKQQHKQHLLTVSRLTGITLHDVFEFVFAGSHIYSWETTGGCCDNFTAKL